MAFPTGYSKYQEVTIQSSQVSADLTDYVIYINLADLSKAGADIFDTVRSDGGDIRVTKSDGTTELSVEVVAIDTTAKTGEIYVKFSGTLSSSSNTTIRIWYNGTDTAPAVTATYGRNAVWSDYDYVSHDGGGGTDSTGNYSATANGGVTSGGISGKLGDATDYDGTDDYFSVASGLQYDSATTLTWQAWVNPDDATPPAIEVIFSTQYSATGQTTQLRDTGVFSTFNYEEPSGSTNAYVESGSMTAATWNQIAVTLSATAMRHYVDGTNTGSDTGIGGDVYQGTNMSIGARGYVPDRYWQGGIDEVRLSSNELSSDWLGTEYENQNSPGTFYSTGNEVGGATLQALTANMTGTASVATASSFYRSLTASMTAAATVGKGFTQALTASITAAASVSTLALQVINLTASIVTSSTITKVNSFKRTLTGSTAVAATVSKAASLYRTLTGAVSAAASVAQVKTLYQTLTAAVSAAASVANGGAIRTRIVQAAAAVTAKIHILFYKKKYTKEDEDYKRKY